MNESVNEPMNRLVIESTKGSITESMNQSVMNELVTESTNESFSE